MQSEAGIRFEWTYFRGGSERWVRDVGCMVGCHVEYMGIQRSWGTDIIRKRHPGTVTPSGNEKRAPCALGGYTSDRREMWTEVVSCGLRVRFLFGR